MGQFAQERLWFSYEKEMQCYQFKKWHKSYNLPRRLNDNDLLSEKPCKVLSKSKNFMKFGWIYKYLGIKMFWTKILWKGIVSLVISQKKSFESTKSYKKVEIEDQPSLHHSTYKWNKRICRLYFGEKYFIDNSKDQFCKTQNCIISVKRAGAF